MWVFLLIVTVQSKYCPNFMIAPQLILDHVGVPRGLEYLASVSSIAVHQLVERLEVFSGIETRNRYKLCNETGRQIYFAYEESSFAGRHFMGKNRGFRMNIMDTHRNPVMFIHLPSRMMTFGDGCLVECPPGHLIGRVVLVSSFGKLEYYIQDMAGNRKLYIRGGGFFSGGEVNYAVSSAATGARVGAITKLWGGLAKEMFTDADSFIVKFPVNLDVHLKASLLGATFLIDFMSYESNHK